MRNGNNRMNWILLALCLISLAGHLLILERLPEQIPVHWNAAGEIDGYGPKSMDLIMGAIPLGIWVLMTALPRLDPRRKNYEKHQKAYGILTLLLTLAMIAFSWMTALAGLGYNVDVGMLIPMVLGVVFYCGQIAVPEVIMTPIQHLSNLTTPLSMLVTGMNLAQGKLGEQVRDRDALTSSLVRLLAFPLLAWALLLCLPVNSALVSGVILVGMAMPAPAVATILGEQYGGCTQLAARTVFLSSLLCIVTIPLVSLLL